MQQARCNILNCLNVDNWLTISCKINALLRDHVTSTKARKNINFQRT
jgi:hypothetical protein